MTVFPDFPDGKLPVGGKARAAPRPHAHARDARRRATAAATALCAHGSRIAARASAHKPSAAASAATLTRLPLQVHALVGLRNGGDSPLNVSYVVGAVSAPGVYPPQYIQNLSYAPFAMTVPADTEVTLPYSFQLSPQLGALPYNLAVMVYYAGADARPHASAAFNATVLLEEPATPFFDAQTLTMLAMLAAGLGGSAWLALPAAGAKGKGGGKAPAKAPRVEQGTASKPSDAAEWLVGTSLHQPKKKPAPPKKNAAKK